MNEEPPGPARDGQQHPRPAARLARFVPALSWARAYQRAWFTGDAIAGFTIWGLLVPEMIAYASLAGLPPQAGLYTLLASLVLYAIFGTSRQLVVAGTSASAVLVYSAVTALHPKDTPDANDELDITSTEALAKLVEELARRDVRVALAHVHVTAADMIRRSASDGKPGPDRIFPNLDSAVTWASTGPASSVPRAEEE